MAIGLVVNSGDDDNQDAIVTPTAPAATTTTPPTTTTPAAATTTIAQVGQTPPPVVEDDPAIRVCGAFPGGSGLEPYHSGAFINPPSDPCEPGPDSYTNGACDPTFLPCSAGPPPLFAAGGGEPGTDHSRTVPDADTGVDGASTAEHAALFRSLQEAWGDDAAVIFRIVTDCGGTIQAGEVPVNDGGITIVQHPLPFFGPCTTVGAELRVTPTSGDPIIVDLPQLTGIDWTVGSAEPGPGLPSELDEVVVGMPRFDVRLDWPNASRTVTQSLGSAEFGGDCFRFFAPNDVNAEVLVKVLDGCSLNDHFWVFAAATTDVEIEIDAGDTLVGHGGAFLNADGIAGPSISGTIDGAHPYDTIFPCGPGDVGITACPAGGAILDSPAFVAISGSTIGPIPTEFDGTERVHMIDFGPSSGPSYSVANGAEGWTVSSSAGDTSARAIIRNNSLTLLAPQGEFPSGPLDYEWTTTVGDNSVVQPATPVAGIIMTPPIEISGTEDAGETEEPTETVEAFYGQLSASLSSGDLAFALERLDPAVFEAYPTECPDALESFVDPDFAITPIAQGEMGPWTWELSDGRTFDVPDALTVTISLAGRGQTGAESEAHLTMIDDEFHWFTFCGAP